MRVAAGGLDADSDVHAGWQVELFQLINRASGRINDVEQTLVRADFKLIHRLLIDVRRTIHRELLNASWQRNRPCNFGSCALGGLDNVSGGLVQSTIIVSPEADSDALALHDIGFACWVSDLRLGLGSAALFHDLFNDVIWHLLEVRGRHRIIGSSA